MFGTIGNYIKSAIGSIVDRFQKQNMNLESLIKEILPTLIEAGVSHALAKNIINEATKTMNHTGLEHELENLIVAIKQVILNKFKEYYNESTQEERHWQEILSPNSKLKIIIIVGINGTGKTSTVIKLSRWLIDHGLKTMCVACDTFRAAAVTQLSTMAEEAGIFCFHNESSHSSSVAYSGVEHAIKNKYDVVVLDTSGRMHKKEDLMHELNKISRVTKNSANALNIPIIQNVMFTLDCTSGQSAIDQIKVFTQYLKIDWIIMTKFDNVPKAGIVLTVMEISKIPIVFICSGYEMTQIALFNLKEYLDNLLKIN